MAEKKNPEDVITGHWRRGGDYPKDYFINQNEWVEITDLDDYLKSTSEDQASRFCHYYSYKIEDTDENLYQFKLKLISGSGIETHKLFTYNPDEHTAEVFRTTSSGIKAGKYVENWQFIGNNNVPDISIKEIPEEKVPDENQTYYLKFKNRVTVTETVAGFICWFNFLKAVREHSSWYEYVMSNYDFYKFDDIYHHHGTEGIADTLVHPDGTEDPFNGCTIKEDQNADTEGTAGNPDNYGSFGEFLTAQAYRADVQLEIEGPFIHVANSHEKGTWKTYQLDKDEFYVEEIDFGKIDAINSAGVITKYVYTNEYELPDDDLVSTETSNIQCQLFIAGGKQTEPLDFDTIKQDLLKMKLDIRNDDDVKIYLAKKFGIETNTEWFIL